MAREFEVTGRIVQGHPMRPVQKRDSAGVPQNNADGTPRMIRQFTLAIPEANFAQDAWPHMHAEAVSGFPNVMQSNKFAWKMKRASDLDPKGVPYSAREGYAGCIALSISSELPAPPPLYRQAPNGQFIQMGPDEIKTGDYCFVRIACKLQVPKLATHTPSLYLNPAIIIFLGYGSEIAGPQIDPNDAFKGRTFALPAGASAMPLAPTMAAAVSSPQMGAAAPAAMPGAQMPPMGMPAAGGYAAAPAAMPGAQMPPMGMPAAGGYAAAPAAMPGATAPVAPAYGFVANAGMPGAAMPGAAMPGAAMPGAAMPGAAMPGAGGYPPTPGR